MATRLTLDWTLWNLSSVCRMRYTSLSHSIRIDENITAHSCGPRCLQQLLWTAMVHKRIFIIYLRTHQDGFRHSTESPLVCSKTSRLSAPFRDATSDSALRYPCYIYSMTRSFCYMIRYLLYTVSVTRHVPLKCSCTEKIQNSGELSYGYSWWLPWREYKISFTKEGLA